MSGTYLGPGSNQVPGVTVRAGSPRARLRRSSTREAGSGAGPRIWDLVRTRSRRCAPRSTPSPFSGPSHGVLSVRGDHRVMTTTTAIIVNVLLGIGIIGALALVVRLAQRIPEAARTETLHPSQPLELRLALQPEEA